MRKLLSATAVAAAATLSVPLFAAAANAADATPNTVKFGITAPAKPVINSGGSIDLTSAITSTAPLGDGQAIATVVFAGADASKLTLNGHAGDAVEGGYAFTIHGHANATNDINGAYVDAQTLHFSLPVDAVTSKVTYTGSVLVDNDVIGDATGATGSFDVNHVVKETTHLSASKGKAGFTSEVALSGSLVDANLHGAVRNVPGVTAYLYQKVGQYNWEKVDTTKTNAHGKYGFNGIPGATSDFKVSLRAPMLKDKAGHLVANPLAVTSNVVHVQVHKNVSAKVSRPGINWRQYMTVSGKVSTPEKAERVYLQIQVGKIWKNYAYTKATKSGSYRLVVRLAKGTHTYRMAISPSKYTDGATTQTFKVTGR